VVNTVPIPHNTRKLVPPQYAPINNDKITNTNKILKPLQSNITRRSVIDVNRQKTSNVNISPSVVRSTPTIRPVYKKLDTPTSSSKIKNTTNIDKNIPIQRRTITPQKKNVSLPIKQIKDMSIHSTKRSPYQHLSKSDVNRDFKVRDAKGKKSGGRLRRRFNKCLAKISRDSGIYDVCGKLISKPDICCFLCEIHHAKIGDLQRIDYPTKIENVKFPCIINGMFVWDLKDFETNVQIKGVKFANVKDKWKITNKIRSEKVSFYNKKLRDEPMKKSYKISFNKNKYMRMFTSKTLGGKIYRLTLDGQPVKKPKSKRRWRSPSPIPGRKK
jgi:hypothetical protein